VRLLVCGGAGYIGSHMCKMLAEHGHEVSVFDDLSSGHTAAVRWGKLYQGDLNDPARLREVFDVVRPEGVLQFAAKIVVPESVSNPAMYYRANVVGSLNLIDEARTHPGCVVVFSSTAAIFGVPVTPKVGEDHPRNPINPYGKTKLMVENILADYWSAYQLASVSFRYFNAAGADPSGEIGEAHDPETHLIPNVLEAALGKKPELQIFGEDYDSKDGTCVRDYIHVNDLCLAHLQGLEYMRSKPGCYAFNLGNGNGFTNKEVLDTAAQVTGKKIPFRMGPRRPGDAPVLVADSREVRKVLNWNPRFPRLEDIVGTAWRWHGQRRF
jgi:UDP-glucose 4-epimerase